MKVHQRDIVEVNFPVGNNRYKPHPAIVISSDEVFDAEEFYIAVMLSSKRFHEAFLFEITPDMVTHDTATTSFAKCQLINVFYEADLLKRIGSMRIDPFRQLIRKINASVFGVADL